MRGIADELANEGIEVISSVVFMQEISSLRGFRRRRQIFRVRSKMILRSAGWRCER